MADERKTELHGTNDLNLIEAPVTWRAYLICGFASFGGKITISLGSNWVPIMLIFDARYPLRL